MVGSDHRVVAGVGSVRRRVLVGCDILARTVMAPVELPSE